MMMRRKVLDALHGYDETLAYEDFDFWVRASRDFQFLLLNEKLTKVRRASGSLSRGWYQPGDRQLHSTFLVCEKAVTLCRDEADRNALRWRLLYEFKQSAFSGNKDEARLFAQLLRPLGGVPASYYAIQFAAWIPLPWALIRKIYYQLRYR
jgi:hypothetical protein